MEMSARKKSIEGGLEGIGRAEAWLFLWSDQRRF